MSKEALLQVRIEKDVKDRAEAFYKEMGTSFAEMVRVMAAKTINESRLPFDLKRQYKGAAFGALHKYAKNAPKGKSYNEIRNLAWDLHVKEEYAENN